MNAYQKKLLDRLRNAIAEDKLVVITGAGVSVGVPRQKGGSIPSWGDLIKNIKIQAKKELESLPKEQRLLLDKLTPDDYLNKVHGDALIEASEIIESAVGRSSFANFVAKETREKDREKGIYHDCFTAIEPRGIITFNYDQCHENSFTQHKKPLRKAIYSDGESLRGALKEGFQRPTLLLKAHGCVSYPDSLVLTSSSYSRIINESRVYRAVVQHILSRFTILIVGFALRDRDFDQILLTIERDYGSSVQDHIAIMRTPKKSTDKKKEEQRHKDIADFATLEARYGLKILPVNEFDEIPRLIKSLKNVAGSRVKEISKAVADSDGSIRHSARRSVTGLSDIGKNQFQANLIRKINNNSDDLITRSEQIYSLGLLRSHNQKVIDLLVNECDLQSKLAHKERDKIVNIECIAHALVALRGTTITKPARLISVKRKLSDSSLLKRLKTLDTYLANRGAQPRLVDYLRASLAEVSARSSHYFKHKP